MTFTALAVLICSACTNESKPADSPEAASQSSAIFQERPLEVVGSNTTNWNATHDVFMAHSNLFSEANPFWYKLGFSSTGEDYINGTIFEENYSDDNLAAADIHFAHNLLIPSITDRGKGQIDEVLANPAAVERLIKGLISMAGTRDLDGFDVNFSGGSPEYREAFTEFIDKLAVEMHMLGRRLTVSVEPAANFQEEHMGMFDFSALARTSVDRIRIKTYNSVSGDGATNSRIESVLNYIINHRAVNHEKVQIALSVADPDAFESQLGFVEQYELAGIALYTIDAADPAQFQHLCQTFWDMECQDILPDPPNCQNVALGGAATASSQFNDSRNASKIIDGKTQRGWIADPTESTSSVTIDLTADYELWETRIYWGNHDFASKYVVEISSDGQTWSAASTVDNGAGGVEIIDLAGVTARYVRIMCSEKGDNWTYEMYEVEVYGVALDGQPFTPPIPDLPPVHTPPYLRDLPEGHYNVAPSGVATATSSWNDSYPDYNGERPDFYGPMAAINNRHNVGWIAAPAEPTASLTIDLEEPHELSMMNIMWGRYDYAAEYDVHISPDGQTWEKVGFFENTDTTPDTIDISTTSTRYVRITCHVKGDNWAYEIYEVQIFGRSLVDRTPPKDPPPMPLPSGPPPEHHFNVGHTGQVTATSFQDTYDPEKANSVQDIYDPEKANNGYTDYGWLASPNEGSPVLTIDLQTPHELSEMSIYWGKSDFGIRYRVDVSRDGKSWDLIGVEQRGDGGMDPVDLGGGIVRFVRITCISKGSHWSFEIYEVEIMGFPDIDIPPQDGLPGEGMNMALLGQATASSELEADHSAMTSINGNQTRGWIADPAERHASLTLELNEPMVIDEVKIHWGKSDIPSAYAIDVSMDGANWDFVYVDGHGNGGVDSVRLRSEKIRYVRIRCLIKPDWSYEIYEVELIGVPDIDLPPQDGLSGEGDNVAPHGQATASSEHLAEYDVTKSIDENKLVGWLADPEDRHASLTLKLKDPTVIDEVIIHWGKSGFASFYAIEVSSDGITWDLVYIDDQGDAGIDSVHLHPIEIQFIRVRCLSKAEWTHEIYELEVYAASPKGA